jgi:hypothetical protein
MVEAHRRSAPVLLLAAMLSLWGCSGDGDGPAGMGALPDAIRAARGGGDIQPAVNRFIPVGAALDPTLALLKDSGFTVYPMTDGRPRDYTGDAAFVAYQKGRTQALNSEEWRILLDSRVGRIVRVDAFVFHDGP